MFKGLWLTFIAVCASPLLVLMLAFMALYVPIFGLIKLIANMYKAIIESVNGENDKPNNPKLTTLRVKHA